MSADGYHDLEKLVDRILIDQLTPSLRATVGRLHAKGIRLRTLARLVRSVGGTPLIEHACEAEWARLEVERKRGK